MPQQSTDEINQNDQIQADPTVETMNEEQKQESQNSSSDWASNLDLTDIVEIGSEAVSWIGDVLSDINIDF